MPPLFAVHGFGQVERLGPGHLSGWNRIAVAPATRLQVYFEELTPEDLLTAARRRDPDWRSGVRNSSVERQELVVVDAAHDVTAILQLSYYSCDEDGEQFGVLVETASGVHRTGLGTAVMSELPRWLDGEVPGAHVFGDVCALNTASERMLIRAGWRYVSPGPCNAWDGGRHQCLGESKRYCASSAH